MGAHPWSYFVPYQQDVEAALNALREREFRAGRYNREWAAAYPQEPRSIEEVLERCQETGSRSILDMFAVSDTPQICAVTPLPREELVRLFGTDRPTRDVVERDYGLFDGIDRGHGIYVVVYDGDRPTELFFAGYSFD